MSGKEEVVLPEGGHYQHGVEQSEDYANNGVSREVCHDRRLLVNRSSVPLIGRWFLPVKALLSQMNKRVQ